MVSQGFLDYVLCVYFYTHGQKESPDNCLLNGCCCGKKKLLYVFIFFIC